jgi:hypothetical protein
MTSIKGLATLVNVQVRIVEIEWASNYLRDLFVYLARLKNVDLYDNELIKVLLEQ